MKQTGIVGLMMLGFMSAPAFAQEKPAEQNARYQIEKTESGEIVRLDKETGTVSTCKLAVSGDLVCRAAADDVEALMAEIDDLSRKNAALEAELEQARQDMAAMDGQLDDWRAKLPSQEEVDEVVNELGGMARKLEERLNKLREDWSRTEPEPKPQSGT